MTDIKKNSLAGFGIIAVCTASFFIGMQVQAGDDEAHRIQQATDSFAAGACNGRLEDCDVKVVVRDDLGGESKYRIIMGNVYRSAAHKIKPIPVLLPSACTGIPGDNTVSCAVSSASPGVIMLDDYMNRPRRSQVRPSS